VSLVCVSWAISETSSPRSQLYSERRTSVQASEGEKDKRKEDLDKAKRDAPEGRCLRYLFIVA
jgi:hypothetical protein